MQGQKGQGEVSPGNGIKGCNRTNSSNPDASISPVVAGGNSASPAIALQYSEKSSSVDSFYEKLSKLHESSGLCLLFNFREASLDLHMFYKEVTERGGLHQVTKDGRWGEVASALNSKSSVSMLQTQLQKLYENLLYQFEQIYYYRTPTKVAATSGHCSGNGDTPSCSTRKRKNCDNLHLSTGHPGTEDGPSIKKNCNSNSKPLSTGLPKTAEQKPVMQTSEKNKDIIKDPNAPVGPRTGYQIFLRTECHQLKKIHGKISGSQNIRNMATDAWRCLSLSDRQPYVEESKKDKERFNREMTAYKERKNMLEFRTQNKTCNAKPTAGSYTTPSQTDGDYYVTLQPDPEDLFVPDESTVELAIGLMKNARPNDPIFQINWDKSCGPLDVPI